MINYITNGERIDGENAPDGRPDILNRPIKELEDGLTNGSLYVSSSLNNVFKINDYIIDENVQTDDLVYLDNITIKQAISENSKLGFVNLNTNTIYTEGEYTFSNRNDLVSGSKYFMSKTLPGQIVEESSIDASEAFVGTAVNSNKILVNLGQILLPSSTTQIIIDNITDINTNADNIDNINTNADNIFDINVIGNDLTNQFSYVDDYGSILDPVELGTGTSKIAIVADNIDSVNIVADNISFGWSGTIVAGNTITVVNGIITDVQ